ncbi:MAG: LysR family transcriptional regulator [Clostridiales Family XIII bacterium]|jgi:DNA-binding transcriptional LysR family regulator|nr:LysR family transcriptional regulator [Clostridiales Family XIII bacterium]
MLNNITLQQIEIFLTVAEQLNLSDAAKELFLNQSAVSRWIQRLEESLGTKLFFRNNRGVELTENGEFLYEELKPLFEKLGASLENIRNMYDMKANILRIGCLDSAEVINVLKDTVQQFEEQNSDILLKIELYDFKDLREQIVCGALDIVVAYSLGFGDYYNIRTKKLRKLDTYLAVSMHSPLAESRTIPVEGLRNEMLYLLSLAEMKAPEQRALRICKKLGFTPKDIKYMPSYFALEMAVKNNRGFAICGSNIIDRFGSDIKLFPIPEPDKEQFVILADRQRGGSELAEQFANAITECVE